MFVWIEVQKTNFRRSQNFKDFESDFQRNGFETAFCVFGALETRSKLSDFSWLPKGDQGWLKLKAGGLWVLIQFCLGPIN